MTRPRYIQDPAGNWHPNIFGVEPTELIPMPIAAPIEKAASREVVRNSSDTFCQGPDCMRPVAWQKQKYCSNLCRDHASQERRQRRESAAALGPVAL